jgi:ornithine cyclodeaminase/alanine dehydrogenase-like protein (mu-crystallin family)
MDVLVTNDIEQSKGESGTLLRAVAQGALAWADVGTLGDSWLGTGQVRTDPHQVTAFVSHGLGTWDTALAWILYTKAQGAGRGVTLPIYGAPTEGRR